MEDTSIVPCPPHWTREKPLPRAPMRPNTRRNQGTGNSPLSHGAFPGKREGEYEDFEIRDATRNPTDRYIREGGIPAFGFYPQFDVGARDRGRTHFVRSGTHRL